MRAFFSTHRSVAIALLIAVLGTVALVYPQQGAAVVRDLKVVILPGGTSGGGEWRTDEPDPGSITPGSGDRAPGEVIPRVGPEPPTAVETSWAAKFEAWIVRLLRAVSAVISMKAF